jgi:hypothetical protein
MLELIGWIVAHRFLFADLRVHLLGWPTFLALGHKTRRSPGRFCRALLLPFWHWDTASAYMSEYPIPIRPRSSRKDRSSDHVIVRNAPEKNVGISGETIVAPYSR